MCLSEQAGLELSCEARRIAMMAAMLIEAGALVETADPGDTFDGSAAVLATGPPL